MNIFGVGGAELVLIIIIMLIVAGPKRMIRWAFVIGQYVGKFRILWEQMVDILQDEVDAAGLDVKIPKQIPTKQSIAKTAAAFIKPYTDEIEQTLDDVKQPVQAAMDETNSLVKETQKETEAAASVDLGVWNDKQKAQAATESTVDDSKASEKTETSSEDNSTSFGAWSQPKSPDQQIEREA